MSIIQDRMEPIYSFLRDLKKAGLMNKTSKIIYPKIIWLYSKLNEVEELKKEGDVKRYKKFINDLKKVSKSERR